jgi:predicted permease
MFRPARWIVAAGARLVPRDRRHEWRREWETELEWCVLNGRTSREQWRRARGAWWHAVWLNVNQWRRDMVMQDLRHGVRAVAARPALTAVAVISLALGLGANMAIFTVVNAVLFRPLPFADPARLIQLANGDSASTLSGPELVDLFRDSRTLSSMGTYAFSDGNVTGGRADAERVRIARVNASLFPTLGTPMVAGRPFAADEDRPGAPPVVVISRGLAVRYFGSADAAIGRTLTLSGTGRTVVGVMPAAFDYPAPNVDVWSPLALDPAAPGERRNHSYRLVGRMAAGATAATVQSEIDAMKEAWRAQYPTLYSLDHPLITRVVSLRERLVGASQPYLIAMLGAVALVLVIACVNVASLLLTYGDSRRRELAISVALGASRRRLAIRSLSESALLTIAGAALGGGLAWPAYRVLVALAPASMPRLDAAGIDLRVIAFAVLASFLTSIVSGAIPLARMLRDADASALTTAGRSGGPAGGRSTRRLHAALVIGEVALAVTLLGGAGLLTRSLLNLQRIELGFRPSGVLTAKVSLPKSQYSDERAIATVQSIVDRLAASPNVQHAAAMAWTPMIDGGGMWSFTGENPTAVPAVPLLAPQQVTPGFFETIGTPILRGRDFTAADTATSPLVAVVNESFGRLFWGSDDPLAHRFKMDFKNAPWITIVGVVPDSRVDGIMEPIPPVMYQPHTQASVGGYFTSLSMTLAARHAGSAAPLAAELRRIVRETDPNVPVSDVRTLDDVVGSTIARERFTGLLVSALAALAALLAGVGIYGVIAYGVAERQFEISLRMALGATRGRILGAVVRRAFALSGIGLALGLAGMFGAGRLLRSVLTGVDTIDPIVCAAVAGVGLVVTLAAVLAPSRRAMRVDPGVSLRLK